MAGKALRKPCVDAVAVFAIPRLNDTKVDVASGAKPSPYLSRDMIVVNDRGVGTAYPARGFDMLKVLGVSQSVLSLNPVPGLVAGITQSHSVFRHAGMIDAAPLSSIESVEAKA